MTTLALTTLPNGQSLNEAMRSADGVHGAAQFQDAMARNNVAWAQPAPPPEAVANAQAIKPVEAVKPAEEGRAVSASEPGLENSAATRDRVRRSLELDGAQPAASNGDLILSGISKLRGAFDAQNTQINSLMHQSVVDPKTLLSMQMAMTQYTIMVDVTSKLTGKAAQSLDTLMKGQ